MRVCDQCDYEMENFKLRNSLNHLKKKVADKNKGFQLEQERYEEDQSIRMQEQHQAIAEQSQVLNTLRNQLNNLRREQDSIEKQVKVQEDYSIAL